jgi:hypothetical protein
MDTTTAHLLEGDGVVSNLFYFLWRQKSSGAAPKPIADLCIPSTVVLEHNFPKAWYYNAEGDAHELERKLGRDVDTHLIVKDFCDVQSGTADRDVVASYYATVDVDGQTSTRVEFLDEAGLQEFLLRRTRRPDGFLQKWVPCSSKFNTVIQAVWSPHLCIVRKRQNRTAMRDKRSSLFERAVTYEGPTHLSQEAFVAPHVKFQVEQTCKALVTMLHTSQSLAVQRMVLNFKVDGNSCLWLLHCCSMRIADRTQLNLAPRYVRHSSDEASEVQLQADALRQKLTNEALESRSPRGGASASVKRSGSAHPLNTMHPKPPSMGPIGDMYSDTPLFTQRASFLARLKSEGKLSFERQQHAPRVMPEKQTSAVPVPPKKPALPKASRRPREAAVVGSELPALTGELSPAPGKQQHRTRLRWQLLRLLIRSKAFRRICQHSDTQAWADAFLYSVYSHFTVDPSPIVLRLAPVTATLPTDWPSVLGLTATVADGHITILASGLPLLRLQAQLQNLVVPVQTEATASVKLARWLFRTARRVQ